MTESERNKMNKAWSRMDASYDRFDALGIQTDYELD